MGVAATEGEHLRQQRYSVPVSREVEQHKRQGQPQQGLPCCTTCWMGSPSACMTPARNTSFPSDSFPHWLKLGHLFMQRSDMETRMTSMQMHALTAKVHMWGSSPQLRESPIWQLIGVGQHTEDPTTRIVDQHHCQGRCHLTCFRMH